MEMSGSQLIIFFILSFTLLVHVSQAQDSPRDFLDAHNAARARVGVGPMRWDAQVAVYAQNYANRMAPTCNLVRSVGGPYGENLAGSTGNLSGARAVNLWVGERQYYDYGSNSCIGGECSRYTQVVWRSSVWLGCAKVRCANGGTFIICSYSSRGNLRGQRPY